MRIKIKIKIIIATMVFRFQSLHTVILIISLLLIKGHSQFTCSPEDITVGTERTDRLINGRQEWKAVVINNCRCPQQDLIVLCNGFQTAEKVDPNVFAPIGKNKCSVNGGRPIAPFGRVEFLYAWDPPMIFIPVSSKVLC